MKISKEELKDIFKSVELEYPDEEISGVYKAVLHLRGTIKYLKSEVGKKRYLEEFDDEGQYKMEISRLEKSLKNRETELKFLQDYLVK